MVGVCKGVCIRYKAQKPIDGKRYASGQCRCQTCGIFIRWEGIWCPCCGYKLRRMPLNSIYRQRLRNNSN